MTRALRHRAPGPPRPSGRRDAPRCRRRDGSPSPRSAPPRYSASRRSSCRACRCSRSRCCSSLWQRRDRRARAAALGFAFGWGSSAPACRGSTSRSTPSAACRCRWPRWRPPGSARTSRCTRRWRAGSPTRFTAPGSWSRARRRGRRLDARRVGAQRRVHRLPLAVARLRAAPAPAARRRLPGFAPLGGVFLVTLAGALVSRRRSPSPIDAHRRAARRARVALALAPIALLVGRRRARSIASTWTQPAGARSPSRWCRATSRRT